MTPADRLPAELRAALAGSADVKDRIALRNLEAEDRLDAAALDAFEARLAATPARSREDIVDASRAARKQVPCLIELR
ncbi:MAG: hypothetical protein ACKVVT_05865 [Dehalococcoidia bacterium]